MSAHSLARKYRPQKFSELVSQETTSKILQSAIALGRIASAYLFSGPRGTGKTTTARLFAKALNCQELGGKLGTGKVGTVPSGTVPTFPSNLPSTSKEAVEPCETCFSCKEITVGSSMDVLELDAASHTQVEKIREVIINSVSFAPVRDRYKIFIIDEVHMLSNHSFNALLKTLEEPPPHSVFILATTEYHKIPATVISRCQRFRFLPLTVREIVGALKRIAQLEKIAIEVEALPLIAKAAGGAMRDGLSLLDQVYSHVHGVVGASINRKQVETILGNISVEFVQQLVQKIVKGDAKSVLELVGVYCKEGADISYLLKELREAFREMLIRKSGYKDENSLLSEADFPVEGLTLERILRSIQILTKCAEQMRWSDSPRIVFECFAVKLCQPTILVEEVLKQMEKEESSNPHPSPLPEGEGTHGVSLPEGGGTRGVTNVASFPLPVGEGLRVRGVETQGEGVEDFKESWGKILSLVQQSKPYLHQNMVKAHPSLENTTLELKFQKDFWLSAVKRNSALVEKIVQEVLKKKVSLVFKLDESLTASQIEEESKMEEVPAVAFEQEAPVEVEAFLDMNLESVPPQRKEVRVEDEGLKRFVHFFPGTLTKKEPPVR